MLADAELGLSQEQMANCIVAENVYGVVLPHSEPPRWVPLPELPIEEDFVSEDPSHVTYLEFCKAQKSRLFPGRDAAARKRVKDEARRECAVFSHAGQPGEAFAPHVRAILAGLSARAEAAEAAQGARGGEGSVAAHHARGLHFTFPAFFRLVRHLEAAKREFRLVFRTFGSDLDRFADDLNLFCSGKHPFFPGAALDGTGGAADRRLKVPAACGAMLRNGNDAEGREIVHLLLGGAHDLEPRVERGLAFYDQMLPHLRVYSGVPAIAVGIQRELERHPTLGVRDCYDWWLRLRPSTLGGKLFPLDPSDRAQLSIFFDDNIDRGCVDARDARTGARLDADALRDTHIVWVRTLRAIADPDYFIDAVSRCEAAARASWALQDQAAGRREGE